MVDVSEGDYRSVLLGSHEPPCVSVYLPTHRRHPENLQDPIRFRNLVKEAEGRLRQKYRPRELWPMLEKFQGLADDFEFWNHALDGLAVLAASDLFKVYRLQRAVPELAIVADSFHIKPLLRILQSADRYQILGISRSRARLFEGNRDTLDEIEPARAVPRTIEEALGERENSPERKNRIYGPAVSGGATRHGTDVREDERAVETERFFRALGAAILEHHSQPSGLPLLLVGLPDNQHLFRALSRNPFLLETGLDLDPDSLSLERLSEQAWALMLPRYLERLSRLVERFGQARAQERGTGDIAEAARAAAAGRIEVLLIEAERRFPGRLDAASGAISFAGPEKPDADDLLDEIAERTLRTGGEVVVVPGGRMPTDTGCAAIFRY